jgi:8-oxo-dGTP diphosphatase
MRPRTRYQGAIVRDGAVLLIRHREHASGRGYWLLPGGGMEPGETAEACVTREMLEETGLIVRVERLLLDVASDGRYYDRAHTYLCTPVDGEAAPGYEPEADAAAHYAITDVRWVPLGNAAAWGIEIHQDRLTCANLRRLQAALGHGKGRAAD